MSIRSGIATQLSARCFAEAQPNTRKDSTMLRRRLLRASLFTLLSSVATSIVANEVGVNLDYANDWSRSLMFADAMKQARSWGTLSNANDTSVKTDSDGWPTQDASVIVITPVPTPPP